jgi:hypothetical protein
VTSELETREGAHPRGAVVTRQASFMSTHRTAGPNGLSLIWRDLGASYKWTVMPVIANWRIAATSNLHSAGRTSGVASMNSPYPVQHRSPVKRSSIAALYAVEKDIRGRSAEERQTVRHQKSRPIMAALEQWLRAKLNLISQKSKLATAIRYALLRWDGLTIFIEDGRIKLDNNTVERSIRPIALNRKNALFAGSDGGAEHWAIVASLIETCTLNAIDPLAYLTDVLTRIVNGHPNRNIDALLPWSYRK